MNKLFAVLVFLFALNCKSTENQAKMMKEDVVLIGKGNLYGSGAEGVEKQNLVISNPQQWKTLLEKLNSVNNVSNSFAETKIDFSKYDVIAVFDTVKTTGGHTLDIDVKTNSKNTVVEVLRKSPEGMATTAMTQPYYIAKIPKRKLPIVFE